MVPKDLNNDIIARLSLLINSEIKLFNKQKIHKKREVDIFYTLKLEVHLTILLENNRKFYRKCIRAFDSCCLTLSTP